MSSNDDSPTRPVSSPIATGGAGTVFEQHVNAYFLSLLLVRALPPILTDCLLEEVHLQTERLGWSTDDVLITGLTAGGTKRRLAMQVKRNFTVSRKDEECVKAFTDFWKDFHNSSLFNRDADALGLVVLRGTEVLLGHLGALLDCARASRTAEEFDTRLQTSGMLHSTAIRHHGEIQAIVEGVEGIPFDKGEFWAFLKALHVLSLDLNTATRQTESLTKTLLAQTASGPNRVGDASTTWAEMLQLVGEGMPNAKSYTLADLPQPMRERHGPVTGAGETALEKARGHSATTLRGIQTKIGAKVSLRRNAAESQLLELLATRRAVLVTGPAGFGKSTLAKQVVEQLGISAVVLAFRAEEFAVVHLDQALLEAQIPLNTEGLKGLLAGQGRKVLFVDSVERLLEANVRGAFFDLLQLAADDPNWTVLLTCRDYSVETVQSSFLEHAGVAATVFRVPPLSEEEIDEVVSEIPGLARPASHPALRELFQNPYVLDKAARMSWAAEGTLPGDERSFRQKFWRDVIRREDQQERGLPGRRNEAFVTLCLRRARALQPMARCDDLDKEAVQVLRNDGLVELGEQTDSLAAPAHDVLEDWAVVRWIDERFEAQQGDVDAFVRELGAYPAVRRSYRKWLAELLAIDSARVTRYVASVLENGRLDQFFRDDTLVAVLVAPSAGEFLTQNRDFTLANGAALLRRAIHLLRVACKTTLPWGKKEGHLFLIPAGAAWPAVLRAVRENLSVFLPRDTSLLAGLVNDWSMGVAWWSPYPLGAEDAAHIAHQLLPHIDRYDSEKLQDEVLRVIIKVPKAGEAAFRALLARAATADHTDSVAEKCSDLVLGGLEGMPACRDTPDAVIELVKARVMVSDDNGDDDDDYHRLEVDSFFGVRSGLRFDFFPASALRGPFQALLQHHPREGTKLVVDLLNHAAAHYSRPRRLEAPREITLALPDGSVRKQWCSGRLWGLHRGMTVGPYVLQSALMALEAWLLTVAKEHPKNLEAWLLWLIKESNNVAVTAVVASVAMAHPDAAGKAAVVPLTSRELIEMDKERMVNEMHGGGLLPSLVRQDVLNRLYDDERKASAKLPHRKTDLEILAFKLQYTGLGDQVRKLIDDYRAALPGEAEQSREDKVWRLALHRMDARGYTMRAVELPPSEPKEDGDSSEPRRRILIEQGEPEADLNAMIKEVAADAQKMNEALALFMWGANAYERKPGSGDRWRDRLHEARVFVPAPDNESRIGVWDSDAVPYVATVCARDHWDEMSPEEQKWCLDQIKSVVLKDADSEDLTARVSAGSLGAQGPAAYILPSVLNCDIDQTTRDEVRGVLVVALTHAVGHVVLDVAEGIGAHLGETQRGVIRELVAVLIVQAEREKQLDDVQRGRNYVDRTSPAEIAAQARAHARAFASANPPAATAEGLAAIDIDEWHGRMVARPVLALLSRSPDDPLAHAAFEKVAIAIAESWRKEHEPGERRGRRHFEFEFHALQRIAGFVLSCPLDAAIKICGRLFDAVEFAPGEVDRFVKDLTIEADRSSAPGNFWNLWQRLADRLIAAPWLPHLSYRSSSREELLSAVFLGDGWKEGVRHWRQLEGENRRVDRLFVTLPPLPAVFLAYARFLFHIGEKSLPDAFLSISERLRAGEVRKVLANPSILFYLEGLLKRFVYGKPEAVKSDSKIRDAVLHLLDELVEAGSSVAYRMRDDFVTPRG